MSSESLIALDAERLRDELGGGRPPGVDRLLERVSHAVRLTNEAVYWLPSARREL
jgi:hypothetical protein